MIESTQVIEQVQMVNKFTNKIDAVAFQRANGGTIFKEHGKDIWFVIRPEVKDVKTIALPMTED